MTVSFCEVLPIVREPIGVGVSQGAVLGALLRRAAALTMLAADRWSYIHHGVDVWRTAIYVKRLIYEVNASGWHHWKRSSLTSYRSLVKSVPGGCLRTISDGPT